MPALRTLRTRTGLWASAGLVTAGLGAGAILGTTMTAGASTSTSTNSTAYSTLSNTSSSPQAPPDGRPPAGLPDTGTVTAVGTSSVTIDGKVYAVTSSSDIDKNGEATLSALAVGDKVTYSTLSAASTPTIDKLHAGNEALDRPTGPPPGQPGGNWSQGGAGPSGRTGSSGSAGSSGTPAA